ncbi:MAG: hypothetical protein R2752_01230 [Vicinamibacterales bacterium]
MTPALVRSPRRRPARAWRAAGLALRAAGWAGPGAQRRPSRGALREIVHAFKFGGRRALAPALAARMQ